MSFVHVHGAPFFPFPKKWVPGDVQVYLVHAYHSLQDQVERPGDTFSKATDFKNIY